LRERDTSPQEQPIPQQVPPYPERIDTKKTYTSSKNDLLGELKNLCVKIPLLQAIKNVPIYNKFIKEECLKKPGRKKKDSPIVNVIGQLANLMLGRVFVPKYLDPGKPCSRCLHQQKSHPKHFDRPRGIH
jgi:hypothetical protein